MDSPNRFNANVSGDDSLRSAPLPDSGVFFIDARSAAKANEARPPGLWARLAGRFWQLLALWLIISAPLAFLVYLLIPPRYEVISLLRIESAQPEILGPLNRGAFEVQNKTYLKTQVGLITSARVLNPALADPLVVNLPFVKNSTDPKADLLEKLKVTIVEDTNLINVALDLADPDEAVTIVQAVVQSYLAQNMDYSRSANRDLTESLKSQLIKLGYDIQSMQDRLKNVKRKRGPAFLGPREMLNQKTDTDPTQPTLNKVTPAQFAKLFDEQVQCDLEYLDTLAELEAVSLVRTRNADKIHHEMEAIVRDEIRKDPNVAALMDQIDESRKLAESRDPVPSPAVLAARERQHRLSQEFDALWATRSPTIRKRLADGDQSVLSDSKVRELEVAVEKAKRKKESFAQQLGSVEVVRESESDDDSEAAYLNHQLQSLLNWEEIVKRNLEQLKFEASQDKYRVVLIDPAAAPKEPSNNKRIQCMAIAPAVVLFLLFGLFLTRTLFSDRCSFPRRVDHGR